MKIVLMLLGVMFLGFSNQVEAQKVKKVTVWQDAFVQGGETASEALGSTTPQRLRVMKSNGDDKYSRTTYLQFNLKKVEDFSDVELNICVRVYPNKKDASANYTYSVYSCDDNKWSESSITFDNKPEKGELLATQTLEPKDDNVWVKISLPADKVKEMMKQNKKRKVTFVLSNDDFNKTNMELISKERTWSNGSSAKREAYLSFK
ncbi:DUF7594 domain-containing protein [Carboxylicivirga sp. N1Y90]|uniref:CBM96 family carbohydrate-binding protein n=1 Tax=Carboxylicivirga fragile TaxID=3417571 RepID=UPI003D333D1B|nr:DNRLRE domain-containing protein [Marinilabiliaceae bacterium N1Y90]